MIPKCNSTQSHADNPLAILPRFVDEWGETIVYFWRVINGWISTICDDGDFKSALKIWSFLPLTMAKSSDILGECILGFRGMLMMMFFLTWHACLGAWVRVNRRGPGPRGRPAFIAEASRLTDKVRSYNLIRSSVLVRNLGLVGSLAKK